MVTISAGLTHHPSRRRLLVARSLMKKYQDEIQRKYYYHEPIYEQKVNVWKFQEHGEHYSRQVLVLMEKEPRCIICKLAPLPTRTVS
jgi:hypothetical protein